ncbi:MAG: hypothetical protein Q8N96_13170 [Methylovulum sp.]|nr:hypothetical protein [Methylovulum sp.]
MNANFFTVLSLRNIFRGFVLSTGLLGSGCVTEGHVFPAGQIQTIRIGETTENDISRTFGNPWSVGIANGLKTWTYRDDRYDLISGTEREGLVIKFDNRGVVSSFNYNSTKRSK